MIKIRLARKGRKKNSFYKIVAIECRSKMAAKPLDIIGYWNPKGKKEGALRVDKDKLNFWLKMGAKETIAVKKLLSPFAKYHDRKIGDGSEENFASEGFLSQRSEGRRYPERKLARDSSDL